MVRTPSPPPVATDTTRQALIEAATTIFAECGYAGGSVRAITRAAGANQAAITYHFGGKDGLYRAVLRAAVAAFEDQSLIDVHTVDTLDPTVALRLAMRQLLSPLTDRGRLGRYVQIFGWEGVNPSPVYAAFFADEPPRLIQLMERLVRRFLPTGADSLDVALTSFWLIQQPIAFVRNADRLQKPPFSITFGEGDVEELVERLTALSLRGLQGHGG